MIPAFIGPYRILRKLGEGGMGAVYEAVQDPIDRRVAVKVLHPDIASSREMVERLFLEARAVNLIDHPGLVQVSDYGSLSDGTAFIAMELLRGQSLAAALSAAQGPLPWRTTLELGWQIADALTAVHQKNIVHRDLKPDNIMLVPDPVSLGGQRAKILDFGIAKLMYQGGQKTRPDIVMGTPAYMSPEQCRGAGAVDEKTDVYALGIILFEVLAGQRPYSNIEGLAILSMHLYSSPPVLRQVAKEVPVEVARLVDRMLGKDPVIRPSMAQVRDRLAALLVDGAMTAGPQKGSRMVAMAVVSCLGLGLAVWWFSVHNSVSHKASPIAQPLATVVRPATVPVSESVTPGPQVVKARAEAPTPRAETAPRSESPKKEKSTKPVPPSSAKTKPMSKQDKGNSDKGNPAGGYRDPFQPL